MPRGGARPGAGRPKKSPDEKAKRLTKREIAAAAVRENKTPLAFMLDVMNDPTADMRLRSQMATSAAPYVHPKVDTDKPGKKETQQGRADEVANRFRPIAPPKLKAV